MQAHQVWQRLSDPLNEEILHTAYTGSKKLYRTLVMDLSADLRRRPNKILEMPRAARHKLFQPLLGLPGHSALCQTLFVHWLGTTQVPLLVDCMEAMGIAHDGRGSCRDFPDAVEARRIPAAVKRLYQHHDPERVTVYLLLLPLLTGVEWPGLESCIRIPASGGLV